MHTAHLSGMLRIVGAGFFSCTRSWCSVTVPIYTCIYSLFINEVSLLIINDLYSLSIKIHDVTSVISTLRNRTLPYPTLYLLENGMVRYREKRGSLELRLP